MESQQVYVKNVNYFKGGWKIGIWVLGYWFYNDWIFISEIKM